MITIKNDILSVSIDPAGAELSSIKTISNNKEHLWQADPAFWTGQAPILFPICGRLLKDNFEYKGQTYYLPKHGFARKSTFEVENANDTSASFVLRSNDELKKSFPFDFKFTAVYSLEENAVVTKFIVENEGNETMYFSLGGHPAFNCKIGNFVKFDEFETVSTYLFDKNSLRIGEKQVLKRQKRLEITEHIFDNDALFLHGLKSKGVELQTKSGSSFVRVEFGDAINLGIWSKPGAPYVCIEPWNGINDTPDVSGKIEEKKDIIALPAKETYEYSFKSIILK